MVFEFAQPLVDLCSCINSRKIFLCISTEGKYFQKHLDVMLVHQRQVFLVLRGSEVDASGNSARQVAYRPRYPGSRPRKLSMDVSNGIQVCLLFWKVNKAP